MVVKLFFEYDEDVDDLTFRAESIEEAREIAKKEVARRNPDNYWSEVIKELHDWNETGRFFSAEYRADLKAFLSKHTEHRSG